VCKEKTGICSTSKRKYCGVSLLCLFSMILFPIFLKGFDQEIAAGGLINFDPQSRNVSKHVSRSPNERHNSIIHAGGNKKEHAGNNIKKRNARKQVSDRSSHTENVPWGLKGDVRLQDNPHGYELPKETGGEGPNSKQRRAFPVMNSTLIALRERNSTWLAAKKLRAAAKSAKKQGDGYKKGKV
jgi:hypothetical protein